MVEPENLNRAIMPLVLTNFIFGMGGYDCRGDTKCRILGFVYSIVCVLAYCALTKASIGYLEDFFLTKASDLGNSTFKGIFYSNVGLAIILIFIGWIRVNRMQRIVVQLSSYDQTMEKLGIPKKYRLVFLRQIYWIGVMLLVISIFVGINYNWMLSQNTPVDIRILLTFTVHYPTVLMCITDMSFYYWVRYTRLKFRQLNDLLRGMLTTTPNSPQHKRVLAMKYDLIGKDFGVVRNDRPRGSNFNTETMKAVKQIHLDLIKSTRKINEVYGVQILITMTASFVLITGLLYDAYTIVWVNLTTYQFITEIVPVTCWILFYAFKIFIVNHACAKTSAEAMDTGDIICELYEPSTSREFRAEIRDFTLQLIQNPLTFTACGFFDLDHAFIQSVIGSITTYLVILIQVGEIPAPEYHGNSTATNSSNSTEDSLQAY